MSNKQVSKLVLEFYYFTDNEGDFMYSGKKGRGKDQQYFIIIWVNSNSYTFFSGLSLKRF